MSDRVRKIVLVGVILAVGAVFGRDASLVIAHLVDVVNVVGL